MARGRWCTIVGADKGDDADVINLRAKIRALVHRSYGGSFRAMFDHYSPQGAVGADKDALERLLEDAGVGNILTRGAWTRGVMERVDTNGDGLISWDEFAQIVGLPEATAVPAPGAPSAPSDSAAPVIGPELLANATHGAGAGVSTVPEVAPAPWSGPASGGAGGITATASAAPRREATGPVLDMAQAIGVAAGLFGFGVFLAALRALGAR